MGAAHGISGAPPGWPKSAEIGCCANGLRSGPQRRATIDGFSVERRPLAPGADTPEATVLLFTAATHLAQIYREQLPASWRFEHLSSRDDEDEKLERLARADVVIHMDLPLTRTHLRHARRLKLVHRQGVGVDALDLDAVRERGVPVCICPVGTPEAVAEHAIMLMLAAGRHLPQLHQDVTRHGRWPKWEYRNRSQGLQGATVGVVGFGRTGQALARRLLAFESRLLIYRRPGRPIDDEWRRDGVEFIHDLDAVFAGSDVVSLHCPLTPETKGMVDGRRLALMRTGSILVNTARGGVVVEADLVEALSAGRPAAAGLDVFGQEPPPPDHPLLRLPNVVATPHCAAGTVQTQQKKAQAIADNVRRVLEGRELRYRVR